VLYITTRSNKDAYTANRAFTENLAPDNGSYVPLQIPSIDSDALELLSGKQFSECVATIINMFFSSKLTAWDVEFAVGRNPIKIIALGSKIAVSELYSNPEGKYSYFVKALYNKLSQSNLVSNQPSEWFEIAVRIATLFGIWSDMIKQEIITLRDTIDISLSCEDRYACIAALYARKMGLQIGMIVLSCNEGNPFWDLVCRGEVKTESFSKPESVTVERLLENILGNNESIRYAACRDEKKYYALSEDDCVHLKTVLYAAVVGNAKITATEGIVARKDGYSLNRNTASAYGGIEDFRAQWGIGRYALLIAENGN